MEIELNKLIEYFSKLSFYVKGVYHTKVPPGSKGKQKTFPYPGFIFPFSGKAKFQFDDTLYLAETGKIIHGGASMNLDKSVVGNKEWEYITVLYSINCNEPINLKLDEIHFELKIGESLKLKELLNRLWEVYNEPGALSLFQTETLFRCVLEEVFICAENYDNDDTKLLFEQISSYIRHRYMEPLTVKNLAKQFNINENRLFYVFNKYSGMGMKEYLIEYRFNRAKELLITGNSNIGKIAFNIGYNDAFHFSRMFKKRFGQSPTEFRKIYRSNS